MKAFNKTIITLIAILAITTLETIALYKGINGALLSLAFTAIAGLGGFILGKTSKPK